METKHLTQLRAQLVLAQQDLAISRDMIKFWENDAAEALKTCQSIGRLILAAERQQAPVASVDPRYGTDDAGKQKTTFLGVI